jgi:hypothetical protein
MTKDVNANRKLNAIGDVVEKTETSHEDDAKYVALVIVSGIASLTIVAVAWIWAGTL